MHTASSKIHLALHTSGPWLEPPTLFGLLAAFLAGSTGLTSRGAIAFHLPQELLSKSAT